MARISADREDLIREATGLPRRVEFGPGGVLVGFRRDGGLSIYLTADQVAHFDSENRLRRAFWDGRLYRSQGETLAELERERDTGDAVLRRKDLSRPETELFLQSLNQELRRFLESIRDENTGPLRQVPADDAGLASDVRSRIEMILREPLRLASPVPGRT